MFKTFLTLVRGGVAAAEENFSDRNALLILDQQMRDAASALERCRRSLALAMAQDSQEAARLEATLARIADLETRVTAAIAAGSDALALEGAQAIASLEAERGAAQAARAMFAGRIARWRAHVRQTEARMAEIDRGRRVARVSDSMLALQRGSNNAALTGEGTLAEAEATLKRLRERQNEALAADEAYDEIVGAHQPAALVERLAAQGFGPRTTPDAADVLARLKAKAAQAA